MSHWGTELIGVSPALSALRQQLGQLARQLSASRRPPPVLLQGETGTGKGLLARALHRAGPRSAGPFVDVNCAAIPGTLLEAELFGFERGAFTGAHQAKPGLFEAAGGGVLFLDEIGLLPRDLQPKLLTVIEDRVVRRVGATRGVPVDPWIMAASNEDLALAVSQGRVRADLYQRLAVLILRQPPLRERGDDIGLLAKHFLARACADHGLPPKVLSAGAEAALRAYSWPGNVRELANVMERATLLSQDTEVTAAVFELPGSHAPTEPPARGPSPALRDTLDRLEREQIIEALRIADFNTSHAAERLGVARSTLQYRMARYGLHAGAHPPRRRTA